jgi:hypothetical protein
MGKDKKYEIYGKVVTYLCDHEIKFPSFEDGKESGVKPNYPVIESDYRRWLSGVLGIEFLSFTGTHLKGTSRSKPYTGFSRIAKQLCLNVNNPRTPEEKQTIWELQVAFGKRPTPGFYNETLDNARLHLKRDHPEIDFGTAESNDSDDDDPEDDSDEESLDEKIARLPSKEALRQRILDRAHGLTGAFGKSLYANLHQTFPNQTQGRADGPELVADCFVGAAEADVMNLFFALIEARQAVKDLAAPEEDLLAELTVQNTLRSIEPYFWLLGEKQVGGPNENNARLSRLETRSGLVAALGFAAIYGLVIRIGAGRAPVGVYDLSAAALHFNVSASVMRALYDEACNRDSALAPRPNPDAELSEEEVGCLRNHFDFLRFKKIVALLFIRSTELDDDHAEAILSEVAQAINSRVVMGSDKNRADLVRRGTELTVGSLTAKVLDLFASTNRGTSSGANAT